MSVFDEWLLKVVADPIVLSDSLNSEAHGNCWSFGLRGEEVATTGVPEVKAFLRKVIEARSQALRTEHGDGHPMLFYVWHDEMMGSIRFSLVSAHFGRLPFGEEGPETVEDVTPIIEAFLQGYTAEGIPMEEFREWKEEDDANPPPEPPRYACPVWYTRIPADAPPF